jgi:hypothetical protein
MQAKVDNDYEQREGRADDSYAADLPDDMMDGDESGEARGDETIAPYDAAPLERLRGAAADVGSRVTRAMRAIWSRLMPGVSDEYERDDADVDDETIPDDPADDYDYGTEADGGYDGDDTAGMDDPGGACEIIDDTDEHIIKTARRDDQPIRLKQPRTVAPADRESAPDHIIQNKNRRPTTIHSPIAQRFELPRAGEPERISTPYNELAWDRAKGLLTIAEPIPEDMDMDNPRSTRRTRSVTLAIRRLDERIVPVLMGVLNAIDDGSDVKPAAAPIRRVRRADRHASNRDGEARQDLPYVCESGDNTFCWYRLAKLLKIYGQKRVDDRGLLHSTKCVALHVRALPADAKTIFMEILQTRARNDPYRAMI